MYNFSRVGRSRITDGTPLKTPESMRISGVSLYGGMFIFVSFGGIWAYYTQVSIDERIAQQCRDLKENFDELEKCKKKFIHFAEINLKKTYEEESEFYHVALQEKYEKEFGEHIIPFSRNGKMFSAVIDRANKKLPPFSKARNASDKGFKDCLLWLSMLEFFKTNGESMVVFVTDDNSAFINHTDFLTGEFEEVTGKNIEFKPNTFYKELMNFENVIQEETKKIHYLM